MAFDLAAQATVTTTMRPIRATSVAGRLRGDGDLDRIVADRPCRISVSATRTPRLPAAQPNPRASVSRPPQPGCSPCC